jgi:hypothetical protein
MTKINVDSFQANVLDLSDPSIAQAYGYVADAGRESTRAVGVKGGGRVQFY